jgi:hypothetical protein
MNDGMSTTGASTPRRTFCTLETKSHTRRTVITIVPIKAGNARESQSAIQMGGSSPSARPLFGFLGIPEDLLTDDAFRRFVQVFIEGALDLEELWPESLVDERGGCSQNDG